MINRSNQYTAAYNKLYENQARSSEKTTIKHRVVLHWLIGLLCFGVFTGIWSEFEQTIIGKFDFFQKNDLLLSLYEIPQTTNLRQKHGQSAFDISGNRLKKNTHSIRVNRSHKRDSTYFIKPHKLSTEVAIQLATRRAKQIAELDKQAALNEALAKAALLEAKKNSASSSAIKAKKIAAFELNPNSNTTALTTQPIKDDLVVTGLNRPQILSIDEIEKLKQDKLNHTATFAAEQSAPMPTVHSGAKKTEFVETILAQVTAQAHDTEIGWSSGNGKSSSIRRQTISLDELNGFTVVNSKLATKESEIVGDQILMANIRVPAPLKRPKYTPKAGQDSITTNRSSLTCLTAALYHEVRGESRSGQLAVAEVISARRRSPSYPNTYCGVIYQNATKRNACQFSFACDGKTDLPRDLKTWAKMKKLANDFLAGRVSAPTVRGATHYHNTKVSPKWRWAMRRIGRIGGHIFYKDPKIKT